MTRFEKLFKQVIREQAAPTEAPTRPATKPGTKPGTAPGKKQRPMPPGIPKRRIQPKPNALSENEEHPRVAKFKAKRAKFKKN